MIASVLLALIRAYQLAISPFLTALLGPTCRFTPSCSHYAYACIADHGALRGGLLSAKRLCKCHPFHAGGYDPPPPSHRKSASRDAREAPFLGGLPAGATSADPAGRAPSSSR